jgi:hypothetical protein
MRLRHVTSILTLGSWDTAFDDEFAVRNDAPSYSSSPDQWRELCVKAGLRRKASSGTRGSKAMSGSVRVSDLRFVKTVVAPKWLNHDAHEDSRVRPKHSTLSGYLLRSHGSSVQPGVGPCGR